MGWCAIDSCMRPALLAVGFALSLNGAVAANTAEETTFTVLATDATDQSIVDAAVKRLEAVPYITENKTVRALIVGSNSDLNDLIDEGQVDIAISDARVLVRTLTRAPMVTTLTVDKAEPQKAAVVFAVQDVSDIQTLDDLKGKVLAFEGVWNRSGYFAPMSHLLREGYSLHYMDTVRETPVPDKINFVFAGDEVNMVAWLHRGLVDGLAFNLTDWQNDEETPPHIRETLRLILNDDLMMDQYLTLMGRPGSALTKQLVNALSSDPGTGPVFASLNNAEQEQLDILVGTYSRTEGNYLAHE